MRGSITRSIPLRIDGSVKIIPLLVRDSTIPIIFKRLKASRRTLRATPNALANSNSFGMALPALKSCSLK